MSKSEEISRRNFSNLFGSIVSSALFDIVFGGLQLDDVSERSESDKCDYRIVDIKDTESAEYDIIVKIEHGNPDGDVHYERAVFNREDLESSDLGISPDIIDYIDNQGDWPHYRDGHYQDAEKIAERFFPEDTHDFAMSIAKTLSIEESLNIDDYKEFSEELNQLNTRHGLELRNDSNFRKNCHSQYKEEWYKTGW